MLLLELMSFVQKGIFMIAESIHYKGYVLGT